MGAVVQFVYSDWALSYPEFATTVNAQKGQICFNEATLFQRNDGRSQINDPTQALLLLYMMTAHVAQLKFGSTFGAAGGLVGRLSSASEGSVSGSVENNYAAGTVQWYQQTKYGSEWYSATTAYRAFRYYPGPQRSFSPWPRLRF